MALTLISLRIGRRVFRPSLIPTLAVMTIFPILVSLGFWQLNRATIKHEQLSVFEARMKDTPVVLQWEGVAPEQLRFLRVRAVGHFDTARQFLLDNRIHEQVPGYYVLTPMRLGAHREAVLVNRGWVAQGASRERLPPIDAPEGEQRLSGHVYLPYGKAFSLGGMDEGESTWPRLIQYLDFEAIEARLGYPVARFTLRMDASADNGYTRDWQPVVFRPEKHIAYAVQWFALAAALLTIFVAVNLRPVDDYERRNG